MGYAAVFHLRDCAEAGCLDTLPACRLAGRAGWLLAWVELGNTQGEAQGFRYRSLPDGWDSERSCSACPAGAARV